MSNAASELFNQKIMKLDYEYNELLNAEKFHFWYNVSDLFLDDYNYADYVVPPLEGNEKASPMSPLKGDEEELKGGKGWKILIPKNQACSIRNNSCKLKNEIRQILYLLHQYNKIFRNNSKTLIKEFP